MKLAALVILATALAGAGLWLWRLADYRADRQEWQRLVGFQPANPAKFGPEILADLPPNAQRFFRATIAPGTPLYRVGAVQMTGRFSLGSADNPAYMDMQASQILAAPQGFLWKMSARRGAMRISGSDSGSWTRFWLMGLGPVARIGGRTDHSRSAFGRYIAEAVFWTPAALLPDANTSWQDTGENATRVTVRKGALEQAVDVTLDAAGHPIEVKLMRWSDANPDKTFRLQPFGGTLSGFRQFEGFTLPTHVEAGNFFGTDGYFPFFKADVTDIRFANPPLR